LIYHFFVHNYNGYWNRPLTLYGIIYATEHNFKDSINICIWLFIEPIVHLKSVFLLIVCATGHKCHCCDNITINNNLYDTHYPIGRLIRRTTSRAYRKDCGGRSWPWPRSDTATWRPRPTWACLLVRCAPWPVCWPSLFPFLSSCQISPCFIHTRRSDT